MNFSSLLKATTKFATEHGPEILTGLSVAGTINTAVLASVATIKAVRVIDEHEINTEYLEDPKERWMERGRISWKLYVPTIISGTATVAMIVCSNRLSVKRQAAVASALATTQQYMQRYRETVEKVLDEEKINEVNEQFVEETRHHNPIPKADLIHNAGGDELFLDTISGRWFRSDMTSVREAVVSANEQIINDTGYTTLNDLYDMLNLPTTAQGDYLGWTTDHKIIVNYVPVISPDGRSGISLEYRSFPK